MYKRTNKCILLLLHNTVVTMGEVEVDQRLRDLQREYLDFLDDEVLRLYCTAIVL